MASSVVVQKRRQRVLRAGWKQHPCFGRDTFAFGSTLTGTNLVADYQLGVDRLAFVGVDGMEDLNFTQTGAGTLVTYDDFSGSVLLLGVNTQTLLQNAATNIVFTETLDPVFGT